LGGYELLKGIPSIISPDLMKGLMEMGHGDEIVLGDGHFPAASHATHLMRCDGHGIPELLDAILKFFPLDSYTDHPIALMAVVPGDPVHPAIWEEYKGILEYHCGKPVSVEFMDRFAFYERTKRSFAVVATSEKAQYANIILKKGVAF
jgi:L-fucose mutarotase